MYKRSSLLPPLHTSTCIFGVSVVNFKNCRSNKARVIVGFWPFDRQVANTVATLLAPYCAQESRFPYTNQCCQEFSRSRTQRWLWGIIHCAKVTKGINPLWWVWNSGQRWPEVLRANNAPPPKLKEFRFWRWVRLFRSDCNQNHDHKGSICTERQRHVCDVASDNAPINCV